MSVTVVPASANLVNEVARRIEEAGEPSGAVVVFPGKRPAHFLLQRLAQARGAGFIPPRVLSMDELVDAVFDAREAGQGRVLPRAEPIDAVAILYEIQTTAPDPLGGQAFMSLDSFFPLGLRIQGDLEELLIEEIRPEEVAGAQPLIDEEVPARARQRLRSLSEFYERFYSELSRRSLSTRSSRYVAVCRSIEPADVDARGPIILAGFSTLTRAERSLFRRMMGWPDAHLLFQDGPGLKERVAELVPAAAYEAARTAIAADEPPRPAVTFTSSPDTHGQVFALNAVLEKPEQGTLIVLPSPDTLFPLLRHCLSRFDPETYNVSLPYPLHRTPLHGFFNALLELASTMEGAHVYVPAYVSFVLHPYVKNLRLGTSAEATRVLFHSIEERLEKLRTRRFMTLAEIEGDREPVAEAALRLAEGGGPSEEELRAHLAEIHARTIGRFRAFDSIRDFAHRCMEIISWVHDRSTAREHPYFTPFSESFVESLESISRSLMADKSFNDLQSYFTLLRSYLKSRYLSFPGTPLHGMQVLGGLETRCLQFDTVYVLDANEGALPEAERDATLLPFAVRQALRLSTSRDREDIAAYHFALLAAGARSLHLYSVEGADRERSRFVERLLWEEQKRRRVLDERSLVRTISYRVTLTNSAPASVPKTPEVARWLATMEHSATSLDAYLACPLQFYYKVVLRLSPREDLSGEIEATEIGTLVHAVLAQFFKAMTGRPLAARDLDPDAMTRVVDEVFARMFGSAEAGANRLLRNQVNRHLRDFLTGYMSPLVAAHRVEIRALEHEARTSWKGFVLHGRLDGIQERDGKPFLVDYKTSAERANYRMRLDRLSLADRPTWHRHIPTLQLPLYVLLHASESGIGSADIRAMFLLLGRSVMDAEIELPLFDDQSAAHESWAVLETVITTLLKEIVSPDVPFAPTSDLRSVCPRCPFTAVCGTSWLRKGRG